ncbi:MAG TPA: exosortase A [Casimicrobiaceae bacterium]|nr:exosortase A [Casimicrobiaceae bacterium]
MMRDPVPGLLPGFERAASAMRAWPVAAATLAVVVAWIFGWYWDTVTGMVSIWARSETFAHGFAVAPISAWLVWRARAGLAALVPQPSWWILAPIGGAGAGWMLGELGAVNALSQFCLVALIVLTVPAVLGTTVARRIAFPLGFLFFMVPIGEFMMPQLMVWTADFTVRALQLTGIPVFREGQNLTIPSGRWSVVEACSGIRYLIASLVVGTLYAYLSYRSVKRRLVFVGVSILVPIVANWIRAYMIVMIGHLSGNTLAVGVDHLIYGWVFFGAVILLMFWVGARWQENTDIVVVRPSAATQGRVALPRELLLVGAMAALTAAIWPLGIAAIERGEAASPPTLPRLDASGGWSASTGRIAEWRPRFRNPSAELQQTFTRGDVSAGIYVGYYRDQASGRKLVASDNVLVTSEDPVWSSVASGAHPIVVDGRPVDARTAILKSQTGDVLVAWYWYWIDGRLTSSDSLAKAYTALSKLTGRGDDGAVVIVYARNGQPGAADATLGAFVREMGPGIRALLERTRDQR